MVNSIILAFWLIFGSSESGVETKSVKVEESKITWIGRKVGGSHNGYINLKEGSLQFENGKIIGGNFTLDMTSITNEDLSGEYKSKLEGHLKSDDFFGVEKYPNATFEITEVIPQGPGNYKITGNVTIKGITKEIKFPAKVEETENGYTAMADITVDRSEFNVRYGSGSFFDDLGDKVIYDDFDLSVSITTSK